MVLYPNQIPLLLEQSDVGEAAVRSGAKQDLNSVTVVLNLGSLDEN